MLRSAVYDIAGAHRCYLIRRLRAGVKCAGRAATTIPPRSVHCVLIINPVPANVLWTTYARACNARTHLHTRTHTPRARIHTSTHRRLKGDTLWLLTVDLSAVGFHPRPLSPLYPRRSPLVPETNPPVGGWVEFDRRARENSFSLPRGKKSDANAGNYRAA